jgi:hypothetical protein
MGRMNSVRRTRDVIQDMVTEFIDTTDQMAAFLRIPAQEE